MNGNDLIEYIEKNPEIQDKFLKSVGYENMPEMIQTKRMDKDDFWEFVLEEMQ